MYIKFQKIIGIREGFPIADVAIITNSDVRNEIMLGVASKEIEDAEKSFKCKAVPGVNPNILKVEKYKVSAIFALLFPTSQERNNYIKNINKNQK